VVAVGLDVGHEWVRLGVAAPSSLSGLPPYAPSIRRDPGTSESVGASVASNRLPPLKRFGVSVDEFRREPRLFRVMSL
jgi:hypothetical protein